MNTEELRAMMTNLRECSEGANDPLPPSPEEEPEIPCAENCGRMVLASSDGVCYQCQCGLHAVGLFDMDSEHVQTWEPRHSDGDSECNSDCRGPGPTSVVVTEPDANGDIPF